VTTLRCVAFDIGETLIDETRIWSRWADRLGVPRFTLHGVLGGVAALGLPHGEAFQIVRPGLDARAESERWKADDPAGLRNHFDADDLYPDVRAAFAALRHLGLQVIIAGNQPAEAGPAITAMHLGADDVLISDVIGVQKPAAEFFQAVADAAGVEPEAVMYVGDRVDNDVVPAAAAGMIAVLLRRGPWGHLQARWPEAGRAAFVVDSLDGVVGAARQLLSPA
jgi:HAD superfamily hydrolase (TIGR01549 family)